MARESRAIQKQMTQRASVRESNSSYCGGEVENTMYFGTDDEELIPTQMQGDEIGTEQEESIPMQIESDEIGTEQVHAISISGEDEDTSVDTTNNINVINLSISKEVIPEVGKIFETEVAAYQFYNAYAYKVGFSIRKSNKHKDRSGKITDRVFCCSCQGKREKDKRNVKSHRSETRFGCLARMKVKYCQDIGKYQVVEFVAEHNHTTCSPRKTHLCRSHRNFTAAQAAEADLAHSSGITPKATVEFMARQVGGRDNLGFIPQDYRNYLRSKRTERMKVGDTGGVLEYLQKMQIEDPNFRYAIQVDEDDLITNIFWADGKMMSDYGNFGDVVCFDTTYRKNKEGRPFAMFVGVNHHKQTIVFGGALLYDETADTFMWLFDTFAKAMCGKKPKTILTDQDAAMAKALAARWPETTHRLCIWHIYQNAAIHLSGVFAEFKDFSKDFSSCIYDYEEEDDFIKAWDEMLDKYNLRDNDWLRRMYGIKEKWALVYGRQTFCADMTTTQRSESMNSVLKKYVSYKHDLLLFFEHFQRLIDDRRYEELKADFRASQSTPCLSFPVEILKHAASIYTPDVFESFQASLCKAHDSTLKLTSEFGTISTYEITPYQKHRHHLVTYDSSEGLVVCSCKKFEFVGILCSHALKVLSSKSVTSIPDRYILKRWTKNAKSGHIGPTRSSESISQEDPKAMMGRRYKELCRLSTQLATRAAETEEAYKIALDGFHKLLEEVDVSLRRDEVEEPLAKEQNESNNLDTASIGKRVRGIKVKERTHIKSSKRPRSALERATKKKKTQGRPPLDDLDFMREPVTRSELPSSPHFLQLHTCTEALGMDASMVGRPLNSLSQISQLAQPSQCAQDHHLDSFPMNNQRGPTMMELLQGESPPERYGESQWDSWLTGDGIWSRHGEQDV